MADKPSRGLVVYGDGHATILPSGVAANSSAHHHLDSFASHASCGFLSLRSTTLSPNDIEDDNTIRELAQLLDVYDFYTAKNEENRQGTAIMDQHQPAVSKISDRFMGLRAAMFTICPRVSYFASKLGFRVFQTEDLSAEFDSTDGVLQKDDNDPKIVTRFLGLLGFSGGHAHEISEVDLVFVHVSMEKTENKATKLGSEANLDWLDKLVGGIMKAVPPGSAIATRLHLSVILSYGSIYDWEERFSLISNSSTETNSDLVLLRPRQSYSLKAGNTLDDIRHHHPMLLAQWQEGVTRKDLTKMFSFEEFIKVMDRIIYTYSGGTVTLGIGGVKLHDMSMQVTTFATAPTFVQLEDEIHMRLSTSRGTHELIVQGKYEAGTGAVGQNQFQALLPLSSESTWELYNEVVRNSPIRMLEVVVEVRSIQQSEYATEEAGIAANMSVQEINNYTLPIATNSVDVHEDSFWRAEPGQNIPSPNIPALSPYVEHAIYYDQVHVGTSSMADISNPFDAAYANNEYDARAYGEVEADDEDIGIEYSDRSEDEEDRTEDTPATDFILCRRGFKEFENVSATANATVDREERMERGQSYTDFRSNAIEEGTTFPTLEKAKLWLGSYAVDHHRPYKVKKSDATRWLVKCIYESAGCDWSVLCSKSKITGQWKFSKVKQPHNERCGSESTPGLEHPNLSAQLIAHRIATIVREQPSICPKALVEIIRTQTHYVVSYAKAWRAKQIAMHKLWGSWRDAYALLPKMLQAMAVENPSMVVAVDHVPPTSVQGGDGDENLREFRRAFWAFGPCIEAFIHC